MILYERRQDLGICVTLAALLCASCVPFPHRSYRTPVIHGSLVAHGKPLAAVPVRVVAEPGTAVPCAGSHATEAHSDATGQFRFCPMPDFQMFLVMMAHRNFHWNVCAQVEGKWMLLRQSSRYTLADSGPREIERIDCEFGAASPRCQHSTDFDITPEKLHAALGTRRCAGIPNSKLQTPNSKFQIPNTEYRIALDQLSTVDDENLSGDVRRQG